MGEERTTTTSVTERLSSALGERSERVRRALGSPLRTTRMAVVIGRLLGMAFVVCFLTGVYSHLLQDPLPWPPFAVGPDHLYAWTQGTHVVVGSVLVPLVLAKLWVVFPNLFTWPAIRSLPHLLERVSLAVLVATALMVPITGILNTLQWYPWAFSFRRTHFALAWVLIGALAVHIAVHLPLIARHWRADADESTPAEDGHDISRRGFLWGVGGTSALFGAAAIAHAATPIGPFSLKQPRSRIGSPQDLPVNRSARQADVAPTAVGATWMLALSAGATALDLSRTDLEALPQHSEVLPISCVEGWTVDATWTGVRLRDLLALVGAPDDATVRFRSLQRRGAFGATTMPAAYAQDPRTLVALRLNDEELDLDHGYPARVIAPGRPGVLQTKWLTSIEVA